MDGSIASFATDGVRDAASDKDAQPGSEASARDFVTMMIKDQLFGIPALVVHDIMEQQQISRIPLAPPEVAGALNLRGRVVTAIDLRRRLGVEPRESGGGMCIVVEHGGVSYCLIVDQIGEVVALRDEDIEAGPSNLDRQWLNVCEGVCRTDAGLLLILQVERLLDFQVGTAE